MEKKERKMAKEKQWTVMADYGCGLWDGDGKGNELDNGRINVPPEFIKRFNAWLDSYFANIEAPLDLESFNKEGRALAVELKKIVGPSYKVFFKREPDLAPEEITAPSDESGQ